MPRIVAHRGDRAHAPENTRRAFAAALAQGADMIEMDLRLSADGQVVVFHDSRLDELTYERGPLSCRSAAELAQIAVQPQRHPEGEDSTIPTLERVLEEFGQRVPLYLELKSAGATGNPALAGAVVELVSPDAPHVLASFDFDLVRLCQAAGHRTAVIASQVSVAQEALAQLPGIHAVSLQFGKWTEGLHEELQFNEIESWAWTVNERQHWRRLEQLGIGAICTDDPGAALRWRKETA